MPEMACIPMRDLARFLKLAECVWDKEPGMITKAQEMISRYGMDLTRFKSATLPADRWQPIETAPHDKS